MKYLYSTVIGLLSLFVTYHILPEERKTRAGCFELRVCVWLKSNSHPCFIFIMNRFYVFVCVDSVGPRVWSLSVNIHFLLLCTGFLLYSFMSTYQTWGWFLCCAGRAVGYQWFKYRIFCHYQHRCIEVSILNTALPVSVSFHLVIVQFFFF
jgi:hypothetical protein